MNKLKELKAYIPVDKYMPLFVLSFSEHPDFRNREAHEHAVELEDLIFNETADICIVGDAYRMGRYVTGKKHKFDNILTQPEAFFELIDKYQDIRNLVLAECNNDSSHANLVMEYVYDYNFRRNCPPLDIARFIKYVVENYGFGYLAKYYYCHDDEPYSCLLNCVKVDIDHDYKSRYKFFD